MLAITFLSTAVAIMMSIVAWRTSRDERRRSAARVAALSADIAAAGDAVGDAVDHDLLPNASAASAASAGAPDLFTTSRRPLVGARWGFALVAGVLAICAAAAAAVIFAGESRPASVGTTSPTVPLAGPTEAATTSAAREGAVQPLELLALGHERDGDSLTVKGVIRNPDGGIAVNRLTAVVFGFNREGEFQASGRSPVTPDPLRPGARSSFVVRVHGAADVVRYRVSFRTDDRLVPHADRRAKS